MYENPLFVPASWFRSISWQKVIGREVRLRAGHGGDRAEGKETETRGRIPEGSGMGRSRMEVGAVIYRKPREG